VRRVSDVPRIPRLKRDAHKGDRGRVLIIAGSLRMSGAARLAGWGGLRGGGGLVTVATPENIHAVVAADLPCALTLPLPARRGAFAASGASRAREFARAADAVALGPGITIDAKVFVARLLKGLEKPLVIDADALNILALEPHLKDAFAAPRVLTPHPGEAARLLGGTLPADRVEAAAVIAERFGAVVVLKGMGTVVCDGESVYVERAGNPGMATGGTGDVLTGLLAARLAMGASPFDAAVQAVHAHARAGDLAAAGVGEQSMIATDLVANLPAALAELCEESPRRMKPGGSRRRE
jgi:ADP-dependent NAD(P)H-hydrate dehydratase